MGNRKKLVLASLVSIMMVLSFAIGLVPVQLGGQPTSAKAAQGATEVAISADGVTPVGDNISIPVGGEQSFTALSITNGVATNLIPTGVAEWSLATDGAAALTAAPGDFLATVTALAPGEAGLYVSTGDGLVDLVNLTLYNLKSAKNAYAVLSSVNITHPKANVRILFQTGATGIPYTLTAETDSPLDTLDVAYSDSTKALIGASSIAPYAVTIDDITALAPSATITAVATSGQTYAEVTDQKAFSVEARDADGNGDGLPDNPFDLALAQGEEWVASIDVNGHLRQVHVIGLGTGVAKATVDIPADGVSVAINDPLDPARVVVVTAPSDLLTPGESGVMIVEVADDLATLLGAQASNVNAIPAGGLVGAGQYAEVSILTTTDGGTTFSEINNARLANDPVSLEMQGLSVLTGDNARFFSYPTTVTNGSPIAIAADPAGAWIGTDKGSSVDDAKMSADLTSLSVFAPFNTPGNIKVISVTNTTSLTPQDYSIGGASLDLVVDNLPAGGVIVTIDGQVAAQTGTYPGAGLGTITVTAPAAASLATPAASSTVDVRVDEAKADGTTFDVLPNGFTYLGPTISDVSPAVGTELGGDSITVTGEGFANTLSGDLGGSALTTVSVGSDTSFTAVTTSHTPGAVAVNVRLSNNYTGSATGLFDYIPEPATLSSVFPDKVFTDGGYQVRLTGQHFVDPTVPFKVYSEVLGLFTAVTDVQDLNTDSRAVEVQFLDDMNMNLVTPAVTSTGLYSNVYLASAIPGLVSVQLSNMLDFTFIDPATSSIQITGITPDSGPLGGGNAVAISGSGFPLGGAPADVTAGNVVRVASTFAAAGSTAISVPVSLYRGTGVTASPAAIDASFGFSSSVLTPRPGTNVDPAFVADALLNTWYSKSAAVSVGASAIDVVISGGTTEITTFDDQRFGGTPSTQQNPFPLGILRFDVAGATGASTTIAVNNLTMADATAAPVADAVGQDGFFSVGSSAITPPPANVYFGPNQATVDAAKILSTATALYVTAPAGDVPGRVDVRVEDPLDANSFAISRANALYSGSTAGYLYNEGLMCSLVDPATSWVFGGTVAHITGAQFEYTAKSVTQVYFGTELAEYAPGLAYTATATDIYVVVPPLPAPPTDLSVDRVEVAVKVVNSNGEEHTCSQPFVYRTYDTNTESVPGASGNVVTTAFYFDKTAGAPLGLPVALANTSGLAGTISVPVLSNIKPGNASDVFALVRATKTAKLFSVQGLPATAIPNLWNFDVHLYSGAYPFDELAVNINTGETPITLRYPTDGTGLTVAANSATLSTYSIDSDFAYDFPSGAYAPDTASSRYQSNILPTEYVAGSGGSIDEVTARLYHLSAIALRKNAPPPVIDADLVGADREVTTGDSIDLTGHGLGWINSIEILEGTDNTKSITVVPANTITSDEYSVNFTFPAITVTVGGPVTVKVVINDGTAGGKTLLVTGLSVKAPAPPGGGDLWKLLLGLLAALLGLAGGGDHGGGGGGPCFIATAAYGTPMADQIDTLRALRDTYMLNNAVGTAFVDLYYHMSPAIADVVAKSPVLAAVVRLLLLPVILAAKLVLAMPQVTMLLTMMMGALAYLRRRKSKKA